ncbi:60Kd inner membrane protein-domain-containing protein [Annulohypoxylon truncatum]|uniref:60Kd inner membrane protein-domain-containing protein n=1 Tax=Annulohypoxylon truncatum TaxID=327061 RepID=UPI0020082B6F|nr:60Kd inner membrane protein-domain-containing protein [Annulohypoxylon truncatum]KAI1206802.1 60Kd inner membrane protein-domain-containing protein [Annulohypoxylon truncatum]
MLPSRGLSRSSPASALRATRSARTQSVRPLQVPLRHFSQAQSRSLLLGRSRVASSAPISAIGSRTVLAATASGVFAQRSGTSRNLSLWPFSSKQKSPAETQPASPSTAPESSGLSEPSEPVAPPEAWAQSSPAPQDIAPSSPTQHVDLGSTQPEPSFLSDLEVTSILDIPEQIGYLKSLGLDFGWGPTACCEWLIEHIHIYADMPWWATLTIMAFAWRALLFVPTLRSSVHQAKLAELARSPEYLEAKKQFDEASYAGRDPMGQRQATMKMMALKKSSGASTIKSLASFLSFPFSWGMFRLLRNMAAIPVPSLETGGVLWFTDLTVHDPYFILPFTSVAITALLFKQTQAANLAPPTGVMASVQQGMIYVLPPVMFLATAWLPAGLQWFFLMFSVTSVIQSSATLNPGIRRWVGMPPLPTKSQAASLAGVASTSSPGGGIMQSLMDSTENKKKEYYKRAYEYEQRRSAEEKQKAQRMEEMRRRHTQKRS